MSETIRPALTREEWGKWTGCGGFRSLERTLDDPNELYVRDSKNGVLVLPDAHFEHGVRGRARHALAALALHQQPFGFTREDVAWLREMVDSDTNPETAPVEFNAMCLSLAARIEALLPPEGP